MSMDHIMAINTPPLLFEPYCPVPSEILYKIFEIAELKPNETFCDVGSGDGRVVAAAAFHGAQATGIELEIDIYQKSLALFYFLGLNKVVSILNEDALESDISVYDVVFTNLCEDNARRIFDKFKISHKVGARMIMYLGVPSSGRRCYNCELSLLEENLDGVVLYTFDDYQGTHAVLIAR